MVESTTEFLFITSRQPVLARNVGGGQIAECTPPGSTLSEVILPKSCGSFPSWVSIDPRINIVRGDLPKSLQILSKLSVDRPQDQHCQRQSLQSLCRSFPSWVSINPPGSTLSEVILPKSLQILSKLSVDWPPGSTLSEIILPKSLQILSKLSVNWPPRSTLSESIIQNFLQILSKLSVNRHPRINIVRDNPSKVFADPFQVECRLTPGSTLSEVILPKSLQILSSWVSIDPPRINIVRDNPSKVLQILSKLSVDQPPRINIVRGNPSKVFADPFQVECQSTPQDQHCQRWSFQSLCRSFPSWVSIDPPGSTLSEIILPKSLQILSKLSVNWPPRINIVRVNHSKFFADPFQVECQLTPPRINIVRDNPSKVFADPFQVECRLTPRINIVRGDPSKVFADPFQLSVNQPPRINIVRGDPSKVFADPFQVECRSTPGSTLSEAILPSLCRSFPSWVSIDPPRISIVRGDPSKSLQILSKLSVNWPPQDQHCQKQSFQSLCRSFPSWVLIDPPRINIVRGNPSKVFADPFQVECQSTPPQGSALWEVILPKSLQILSKLSVDRPPRINIVRDNPSKSLQILSKLSVNRPPSPPLPSLPT